ncbi:MAG: hypothetical protein SFU56_06905 [Capsulimonadales bacterium]|nr:hypothetical protein [Capsulimonadales bacterium]
MSRFDLSIYNEATGFVMTSPDAHGLLTDLDATSPEWREGVRSGRFLPVQLVQDDAFDIRVVVDEPLTPEEDALWVDRWAARLIISGGTLVVTGGCEYLEGEDSEDYLDSCPVPSGEYLAEFHTYIPSINGWHCLSAAPGGDEPLGAYFRRTRPDEEFPLWLRAECIDDPEQDPGHEDEWEDSDEEFDEDDGPAYMGFVLRLTPIERLSPEEIPEEPPIHPDLAEPAWIPIAVDPRKPERFPIGLVVPDEDEEDEEDGEEGDE